MQNQHMYQLLPVRHTIAVAPGFPKDSSSDTDEESFPEGVYNLGNYHRDRDLGNGRPPMNRFAFMARNPYPGPPGPPRGPGPPGPP